LETERLLDDVGRKILSALQENARLNYAEIGRRVGLTANAVADRVRRMEEAGIILGYHVEVNPEKIGLPIAAYIRIATNSGRSPQLDSLVRDCPEVIECHVITGPDSYILKVVVPSVHHLERFLEQLRFHGQPTTSVVLSTLVGRRRLTAREPASHAEGAS
jgi:Lrp/AsnC family transcriptional regulator, leucine-responsive regulatory protein